MENVFRCRYYILYILITAIWGFSFILVNFLVHNIPVFLLIFIRFCLGIFFIISYKLVSKVPKITTMEIKYGTVIGIFLFCAFALQTYGASFTQPSKNGLLTGLYVIFVPVISSVYSRKNIAKSIFDSVVCIIGLSVLFNILSVEVWLNIGDVLSISCALFFAFHFILLEKFSAKCNIWNLTLVQLCVVAVLSLFISIFLETDKYNNINITLRVLCCLVFLGMVSTGFSYIAQTLVQSKLAVTTVSLLSCMESVFSVIFSIIIGYEKLTYNIAIGASIIVLSMVNSIIIRKK